MRKVHIDFESRSRMDIWECGAAKYAAHASTDILCLAYAIDDDPVKIIRYADIATYPLSDPFEELRELANDKEVLFYAHNAYFEQCIWKHKLIVYGLPQVPINRWRCTAAKALSVGLPKALKDSAEEIGAARQKDVSGRKVMLRMCKPRTDGEFEDSAQLFTELEEYCGQDVETERALDHMLPDLNTEEQMVWGEDQVINHRGVQVDTETVDTILDLVEQDTIALKKKIFELTDGELDGVSRRVMVLNYLKKIGVTLPDFRKETVANAIATGTLNHKALTILQVRQQLGSTSVAKYKRLKAATMDDGRLRDSFVYHSASTGRWGGKVVQLQNLPKGTFSSDEGIKMIQGYDYETLKMLKPNLMSLFSSCVRGMFIAKPGHDLIVADYASIEARVLMWAAGEDKAVKLFAEGKDIYTDMAQVISPDATRQLGKQVILGCGYGMGHKKFKMVCESYGMEMTDELALKAVNSYRQYYPKVKKLWYGVENTAIRTVQKHVAGFCWELKGDFLWYTLPSGRKLAYHKPRVKMENTPIGDKMVLSYMTTDSMTKKYVRRSTFGGKLVENIIQAIARDILAWSLIRAERAGYQPVMHVHDEIVVEVPEEFGSVEEFEKIICHIPKWAKNCPISAEGWRGKRYRK